MAVEHNTMEYPETAGETPSCVIGGFEPRLSSERQCGSYLQLSSHHHSKHPIHQNPASPTTTNHTMEPPQAQSHLLHELKSHNIPLTSDDVSWAFSNTKTAIPVTDWVERYLGHDTLVSLEEAEM